MTPEIQRVVSGALDSLLLLGILVTAVVSIFKAGRWFGGMVRAVDHLADMMQTFKKSFDQHVTDEDRRFTSVEKTLHAHGESIRSVHDRVAELARNTNGKAL